MSTPFPLLGPPASSGTDLAASPAFVAVAALRRGAHAVNPPPSLSPLSRPGRRGPRPETPRATTGPRPPLRAPPPPRGEGGGPEDRGGGTKGGGKETGGGLPAGAPGAPPPPAAARLRAHQRAHHHGLFRGADR